MIMAKQTSFSVLGASVFQLSNRSLLCHLFLLVLIHSLPSPTLGQASSNLVFTQSEQQDIGDFVGSVSRSPNILNMVGEDDRVNLRYSILPDGDQSSKLFSMDTTIGNITFAGIVDREGVCPLSDTCEISFGVAVSGDNNFFTRIPVKVVITDINDNSPQFPSPSAIDIHISEAAAESFSQSLPTATDADMSQTFGVNSYKIEPQSDVFRVEQTKNSLGTPQISLGLKKRLNREDDDKYTVLVVASDGGNPPKSGTLTVNVIVDDVNDNSPTFTERNYDITFTENDGPGYEIVKVNATDKDAGENGKVVYALSAIQPEKAVNIREKIAVNNITGSVTLKQSFISGQYSIFIDTRDMGTPQKYDQAAIRVAVLDTVNNKPSVRLDPVQKDDLPPGWVSEDAATSTVVAVLTVEDPDTGKNGNVSCRCLEPTFQLQQLQAGSYKLMVATKLDRETNSSYTVEVTCSDQGTPSLNASASINISVFDKNDNSPVFGRPMYNHTIMENNMRGDTVLVVNALDNDDGENRVIEYRLKNASGTFTITRDSGVIKANRRFDREDKSKYEFQVLAVDNGSPRRTGTADVIVNIQDLNDVAPVFSQTEYKFHIYENRDVDSIVGNVTVTDPDLGDGGEVSLFLEPFHEEDIPFSINGEGRLSSLQRFDREQKDNYRFFMVAKDNGIHKLSSSAQVVIEILDVNDNHPSFVFPSDQNFSAYVNIPLRHDDVILQVDVFDDDANQNSIVTYSIIHTNGSNLFRIGKFTGDIIANKDLNSAEIGTYFITINATDQGTPVRWEARTLHLVVQSESASADDVIADQNVLIVVCIVCFTVIVSGAVLVAMCVLRRADRQKKLHYATTCCPDSRRDSDSGSITDHPQEYDLAPTAIKEQTTNVDRSSPYHQQQQQQQHHKAHQNHSHGDTKAYKSDRSNGGYVSDVSGRSVHSLDVPDQAFHSTGQRNQVPEIILQRHDDFHSTSSAETATGDSGHGSDEDMSNSLEHANSSVMMMEHAVPLDLSSGSRELLQGSTRLGKTSQHPVQLQSALKNSRTKGSNSSVRFDPHVTDIYGHRLSLRGHPPPPPPALINRFNSGSSSNISQPTRPSQLQLQPFTTFQQQQTRPLQTAKHRQPTLTTSYPHPHGKASLPLSHRPPQRQISLLSQSSLGDDGRDDSDLNTTTSGSYSVASDDVARLNSLGDIKDMYV